MPRVPTGAIGGLSGRLVYSFSMNRLGSSRGARATPLPDGHTGPGPVEPRVTGAFDGHPWTPPKASRSAPERIQSADPHELQRYSGAPDATRVAATRRQLLSSGTLAQDTRD